MSTEFKSSVKCASRRTQPSPPPTRANARPPFLPSRRYLLSSVCGVDLAEGDDGDALSRKLMDPGYEDAPDDAPQPRSWLPPILSSALDSVREPHEEGASRYSAPAVRYDPPDVTSTAAPGGMPATWTEGSSASAGDLSALRSTSGNPLDDLNALMAEVEQLEAAGDLDAAARLLSGAVQRR